MTEIVANVLDADITAAASGEGTLKDRMLLLESRVNGLDKAIVDMGIRESKTELALSDVTGDWDDVVKHEDMNNLIKMVNGMADMLERYVDLRPREEEVFAEARGTYPSSGAPTWVVRKPNELIDNWVVGIHTFNFMDVLVPADDGLTGLSASIRMVFPERFVGAEVTAQIRFTSDLYNVTVPASFITYQFCEVTGLDEFAEMRYTPYGTLTNTGNYFMITDQPPTVPSPEIYGQEYRWPMMLQTEADEDAIIGKSKFRIDSMTVPVNGTLAYAFEPFSFRILGKNAWYTVHWNTDAASQARLQPKVDVRVHIKLRDKLELPRIQPLSMKLDKEAEEKVKEEDFDKLKQDEVTAETGIESVMTGIDVNVPEIVNGPTPP